MSQWSIRGLWLSNSQLYPAVDARGCLPNSSYNNKELWNKENGAKVMVFNALSEKKFNFTLGVEGIESEEDFHSTNSAVSDHRVHPTLEQIRNQDRRGFIVKAFAEERDGSWEEFALTTETGFFSFQTVGKPAINFEFSNVDFKRVYSYRESEEPWAFVGRLRFELTIVSTPSGKALDGTGYEGRGFNVRNYQVKDQPQVEFYAICPALPKCLRHEGIPIDLLRFALGPQHKRAASEASDYPYLKAITRRVFESGFIYDRSGGSYSFTAGAGYRTQLTKFLRIWTILNKSAPEAVMKIYGPQYEKNPPTVNCMDQTGILGICMSFACIDEDDRNSLGAYFMKPFGFLHDSALVGFGKDASGKEVKCNNPFTKTFKKVPELYISPTDRNRSYFTSHVFLEFRDRIYDACAGPYTGGPFAERGDLKAYLTAAIDQTPGTYPSTFRDATTEKRVADVDISKYSANPDNPTFVKDPVSDRHGGILGEVHDLMLKGSDWTRVPDELNHELDDKNFSLDIPTLNSTLIEETKNSDICRVDSVEKPETDTGATVIERSGADHGEVTWALKADGVPALLYLRVYPSFERAAAERSGMYADGDFHEGPTLKQLATDRTVSGRFLIDCQSAGLDGPSLVSVVSKVREIALRKGNAIWVGNELADGFAAREGQPKRHHVIKTEVEHCLDVDWSYTTGNIFLLDYESGERAKMEKDYWVYEEKFVQDENEKTITTAYRFKFHAKRPGIDTVKLVFYDRTYDKPVYRFIDFKIEPERKSKTYY
ncbi:hypothetical protein BKA66DRAFT_440484 [Pyrenochaeta sp. MPI-SDFR-AT-0127]|nr:hypothetical protein BKA66DRAFT_440484 [Pyrenochaeta sp. MPI-SDFR-AT-0127]